MNFNLDKNKLETQKILDSLGSEMPQPIVEPSATETTPINENEIQVVTVQIYRASSTYFFEVNGLELKKDDPVIVNTESGTQLGYVIKNAEIKVSSEIFPEDKIQKIIRVADKNDFTEVEKAKSKEKSAFDFCNERIKTLDLDMKLLKVRYLFGCKKANFYFTAEGRVDFRQLVKDLVAKFKIRIELRQIGVRDETKLIGGLASCGMSLCCCTFNRKFPSVSIKMGKEQGLSLNPSKISGMCGRLLCCLSYEYKVYHELGKGIPKVGKRCIFDGRIGKVLNVNILARKALVLMEDGGAITTHVDKIAPLTHGANIPKKEIPTITAAEKQFNDLKVEFADLDVLPFFELK